MNEARRLLFLIEIGEHGAAFEASPRGLVGEYDASASQARPGPQKELCSVGS